MSKCCLSQNQSVTHTIKCSDVLEDYEQEENGEM